MSRPAPLVAVLLSLVAASATAQDAQLGRVASSSTGEAGQRQTREQIAPDVQSTRRISSRIESRVRSRIYNRIDRAYDPQSDAASPFVLAGDQARTGGKTSR